MSKIRAFISGKKYYIIALLALLIVLFFVFSKGNDDRESYVVRPATVSQSVVLSGTVQTSDRADLGFASSGRIARIHVSNNQNVREGQALAQLEIGELLADLKIKEIESKTSDVDLEKAKQDFAKIQAQENAKVESARRTLLSEGLEFTPNSASYEADPPTVTGAYDGAEGIYKVSIDKENATLSDYTLRTFNLEKTVTEVDEEGPTKLGSRGLYIDFPDGLELYSDTIWYLEIPNKASSSYASNLNEYNEALENRERAVKQAELDYEKLLTEGDSGQSLLVRAEMDKINAEIRKNTIYAPFSGKVTNLEKEVGENASSGERIISMLGEERLEVVLQVSELDVSRLVPGSAISMALDAFPGETFSGTLRTINSKETEVEGVPVYEAFVELPADPRIKTGMSAKGTALLASKENVLAIPGYMVSKTAGANVVKVLSEDGKKTEDRSVALGLVGTDSLVEVISGLSEGEKIVRDAE